MLKNISKYLLTVLFLLSNSLISQSNMLSSLPSENLQFLDSLPPEAKEKVLSDLQDTLSLRKKDDFNSIPSLSILDYDDLELEKEKYLSEKFGYDFFDKIPTTFSPTGDYPIPRDYKLGIGDSVSVFFTGVMKQQYDLTIGSDGSVLIPEIGRVNLLNRTLAQAELQMNEIISQQYQGTQVFLSIFNLAAIRIYIVGNAKSTGSYIVSPYTTLSNALTIAGGVKEEGSLRNITLVRSNGEELRSDMYELLISGNRETDYILKNGDTIVVNGAGNFVEIIGEINRPMMYEIDEGDNFEDLINYAQGLQKQADITKIRIFSSKQYASNILEVDLDSAKNMVISDFDKVQITRYEEISISGYEIEGPVKAIDRIESGENLNSLLEKLSPSEQLYPYFSLLLSDLDKIDRRKVIPFNFNDRDTSNEIKIPKGAKVLFFDNKAIEAFNIFSQYKAEKDSIQKYIVEKEAEQTKQQDQQLSNNQLVQSSQISEDFASITPSYRIQLFNEKYSKYDINILEYLEKYPSILKAFKEYSVNLKGALANGDVLLPVVGRFKVNDLVSYNGGVTSDAETALVSVIDPINNFTEVIDLNSNKIFLNGSSKVISIPRVNSQIINVSISGEVENPGSYSFLPGATLQDLYDQVGNFSRNASTTSVVFTRSSIIEREAEAIKIAQDNILSALVNNLTNPSTENPVAINTELVNLFLQSEEVVPTGRLVGDLEPGSANASSLLLNDGDQINIPTQPITINILGEVKTPITTVFKTNYTVKDYIQSAGDFTEFSDKSAIYIIKSDGTSINVNQPLFSRNFYELQPGDTIVVPKKVLQIRGLALVSTMTKVLSDISFAAASLNAIRN